jgi:hypothetical protein
VEEAVVEEQKEDIEKQEEQKINQREIPGVSEDRLLDRVENTRKH